MNTLYDMLDWGAKENTPNKIIIHSMGEFIKDGQVYSARDFLNKLKLSAHILIKPDGDIIRCRHDKQGAYHARGFNTDSLGVEFLVEGEHDHGTFIEAIKTDWVTPEQYKTGIEAVDLMLTENQVRSVLRHSDISPGRKLDPGQGFKWKWFNNQLDSF